MSAPLQQLPDALGPLLALRPKLADSVLAYYDALLKLRNPQMPGRERRPLREIHVAERVRKITSLEDGSAQSETEAEVPWEGEWRTFPHRMRSAPGGGHLWHLVLGEPGSGKSTLTNHAVLQLTDEGLAQLKEQKTPLEDLPVPIWLDLPRFIQDAIPKEGVIGSILEALLRQLQSGSTQSPVTAGAELTSWLERALRAGRAWLFLDGLDRVTRRDYDDWLRSLADLRCPTIITCRMRDYGRLKLPVTVREYWLAKFGRTEQEAFVDKWFERQRHADNLDNLKGEQHTYELKLELDWSPRLRATCGTPLLLAFACLVKSDNTGVGPAESKIYESALRHLLTPQPEAGRGGVPNPSDTHRADALFELLTRVAPPLFDLAKGSNLFSSAEARALIGDDDKRPSARDGTNGEQQAQSLIDEMIAAGVLIAIDAAAGAVPQLSFLHATLLEFLVAKSLWKQRLQGLSLTLRAELEGLVRPERREVLRLFVDLRNTAHPVATESVDAAEFLKLTLALASGLDAPVPPKGAAVPVPGLVALKSTLVETAVREWARHERIDLPRFAGSEPPRAESEPPVAEPQPLSVGPESRPPVEPRPPAPSTRGAWIAALSFAGVGLVALALVYGRNESPTRSAASAAPLAVAGSPARSDSEAFAAVSALPSAPPVLVKPATSTSHHATGAGGKQNGGPHPPPTDAGASVTAVDPGPAVSVHERWVPDGLGDSMVPRNDGASDPGRNTQSAKTDRHQ